MRRSVYPKRIITLCSISQTGQEVANATSAQLSQSLPPKNPKEDQAVFLSYYKTKDRWLRSPKIVAGAEPKKELDDDDTGGSSSDGSVVVESVPGETDASPYFLLQSRI